MKHIHRFFTSEKLAAGRRVALAADDSFHASRVLRLRPGDGLELADPEGKVFRARIIAVNGAVEAQAETPIDTPEPAFMLSVVQALPSGRKMDLIVEKLSELGTARLVPVYSEKSVVPSGKSRQFDRWQRLALAAASQSRRSRPLEIEEPRSLSSWLEGFGGEAVALVTEAGAPLLGECQPDGASLSLLIGPEAGFTAGEIDAFRKAGVVLASLGPRLLRTETAALAAAAIVLHRQGALG